MVNYNNDFGRRKKRRGRKRRSKACPRSDPFSLSDLREFVAGLYQTGVLGESDAEYVLTTNTGKLRGCRTLKKAFCEILPDIMNMLDPEDLYLLYESMKCSFDDDELPYLGLGGLEMQLLRGFGPNTISPLVMQPRLGGLGGLGGLSGLEAQLAALKLASASTASPPIPPATTGFKPLTTATDADFVAVALGADGKPLFRAMPGYNFKTGSKGLGYYKEGTNFGKKKKY